MSDGQPYQRELTEAELRYLATYGSESAARYARERLRFIETVKNAAVYSPPKDSP